MEKSETSKESFRNSLLEPSHMEMYMARKKDVVTRNSEMQRKGNNLLFDSSGGKRTESNLMYRDSF